jgi:hypothetical protein
MSKSYSLISYLLSLMTNHFFFFLLLVTCRSIKLYSLMAQTQLPLFKLFRHVGGGALTF